MSRRSYYTEPWKKELEVFQNFAGGINTTAAQDAMADYELSDAVNVALDERGSVTRRTGMVHHLAAATAGKAQGYFRFYKTAYEYHEIVAIDGRLEKDGVELPIEGLPSGFQKERPIEAAQYHDKLYIATGTKLVEYDGAVAKVVVPYSPQPLEALYVGTNGLAENPNDYLASGDGPHLQITGVTFSNRYGVMNEPFTLTAYHLKKAEDQIEYQFEYRFPFMEDGVWYMGQDWSDSNQWTHVAQGEGDMQFRVNGRVKGLTVASAQYLIPTYRIKPAPDPNDIEPDLSGIHTCNRILVHWERIILYGDTVNFNMIHISHLKNPNYFPVPSNLMFETTKNEPLNKVVRFRDHLVAFTDSSIQALFGKHPAEFRRVALNTSIGCIAPDSAVVLDNYIAFLSADGVYYLKSVGYVDDKANVAKLDTNISNLIPRDRNACAIVFDDQYQIVFPDRKERFRYYKILGTWVRDESPELNISTLQIFDNELYGLQTSGNVIKFSDSTYSDLGHIYTTRLETKYFNFGQPYHRKKLKELQITATAEDTENIADLQLFIDGVGNVSDVINKKIKFEPTEDYNTFVSNLKIKGSCLRTKVRIEHKLDRYIQFLGMMFVFKAKKP